MPYVLERENGAQLRTIIQIEGLGDFVSTFYDNPRTDAGILILPGFTEHRSSFDAYGKFLQHGYKVWAFDINGQASLQDHLTCARCTRRRRCLQKACASATASGVLG